MLSHEATRISREGKSFLDFKRESLSKDFSLEFSNYSKSMGDVYYWPQGGFHVVTKASLAKVVLTHPAFSADRSRFFISRMPNLDLSIIKDFFSVVGKMMVMSDDKEHAQRRLVASSGLNEKLLSQFESKIAQTVEHLLLPFSKNREIEFVENIARALPQSVLADIFCIPQSDRAFFNRCSNIMTGFFGGAVEYTNEVGRQVNQAAIDIRSYFEDLLRERRNNPQDDFFTGMLTMQKQLNLADDELISQAVMMLVAGLVTTTDQICNNLFLLLNTPQTLDQLQKSPELLPSAIEEFKRLDPAVTFLFRVARAPFILGGQRIEAGETLFIANHAICRDPDEFEQPDQMLLDRKVNRHFAYGHGPHYCMGAKLGRMQMTALFSQMISKFPKLSLDPERPAQRDHYSLSFSGFKSISLKG